MVRSSRRGTENTDDNEDSPMRVKAEKLGQSAKGQSIGQRTSSRKTRIDEEEDEEDEEDNVPNGTQEREAGPSGTSAADDGEEEDREGSPKGHKRARKNTVGEAYEVDANGEADVKPEAQVSHVTLPRDARDGFVPGSIVRIRLKNFVTYDYVEFSPGPYLNMIFGPNGTGKSTIASAICIGLNFPAHLLGRATELNLFVKKECDDGYVEIELKGATGRRNLVIRRKLSAKSKSSTFILNGQPSTGREINDKMAELNVQVNNLCSFLPQDKVAEFARMSPEELLKQTQKAAGDPRLTHWHEALISSGKDLREIKEHIAAEKEQLRVAEDRNQLLENDVQRFQQRQVLERDIALLELAVPVCDYLVAKDFYDLTKKEHKRQHKRVAKLEERNKPAHTLKEELEKEQRSLERQRDQKKKATKQHFGYMKSVHQDNEKLEKESDKLQDQLDKIRDDEQARIRQIAKYEELINKLQRELDNPPEVEDNEPLVHRQREIHRESAGIRDRQQAFQARQRSNVDESARQRADIQDALNGIARLENVAEQKLNSIGRWDRDTADTIVWLRKPENQRRFRMEVFEPAAISLKVENPKYVHAIEACLTGQQLKTFVVQCQEDSALLNRLVNDSDEALGRRGRITVWYRPRGNLPPPPLSPEEMRQLGFDGYALDYIDCPDGLLWFLQKDANMHRTAIALNVNAVDVNRAMDAISNPATGGFGSFIVGKVMNNVSRSAYGKRLATNQTKDVRAAQNLGAHQVDENQKREFDRKIADARRNLEQLEAEHKGMADEEKQIKDAMAGFKTEMDDLKKRLDHIRAVKQRIVKLESQIQSTRKALDEERKRPSGEEKKVILKQKLFEVARKRAKSVQQYADHLRAAIKETEQATSVGLHFIQTGANLDALVAQIETKDEQYQKALKEYQKIHARYIAARDDAKTKLKESKQQVEAAEEPIKALFKDMEPRLQADAKENLEIELENMRARLELLNATNPGVVEQYERRKVEIANLQAKIEQREKTQAKIQRNIDSARTNWYPALQRLVASVSEKFSIAFDRTGRAGEVRVQEHEDYDKWSIVILVKFRNEDKLQPLTGTRQSGGERSFSTMMYLMSLTEQARAPFSLVDEINQGMDQKAERQVHNQLVEVTCRPDAYQYFLITPKLLPGLRYHKLMKVLCVNNGEWLPEEKGLGSLKNMLDNFAARRAHGAGAA